MGGGASLSTVEKPPPYISRSNRALAELAAELIAEQIAERLPPPTTQSYEAAQVPSVDEPARPVQALIFGPPGTGTSPSVYVVSGGNALWPLSVMCRLTTSAVVGVRQVALEYRDGDGNRYLVAGMPNKDAAGADAGVPASTTQSFCWHPLAGSVTWPVEDAAIAPLPQQHLFPGSQLALKVWQGDAGDVLDQVKISARYDPLSL